jgi:hypothetical protein
MLTRFQSTSLIGLIIDAVERVLPGACGLRARLTHVKVTANNKPADFRVDKL